jgi:hypothetical protein
MESTLEPLVLGSELNVTGEIFKPSQYVLESISERIAREREYEYILCNFEEIWWSKNKSIFEE